MKNLRADVDLVAAPLTFGRRMPQAIADYVALTKPRLNVLVVATSAAGYYLGAPAGSALLPMVEAVAGTALVAAGAAVLNQVYERDTDAMMERTRHRPIPDGRVSLEDARAFGIVVAGMGLAVLLLSSWAAFLLAAITIAVYVMVYTPMKRRSAAATLVGAIPGALPPLIGWSAATGNMSAGGWALFAIVFLWQIPHFMAIAWLFRDDYARAGFPMLPVVERDGRKTGRQAVLYAAALVPVSLMPTVLGVTGAAYFWAAMVLGGALFTLASRFAVRRDDRTARWLFYASITYLPLLWAAMILDH